MAEKADAKKVQAKKVTIYRNGDPSFRPVQYTFQPQKTKTFAKLLEDIDRVAPPLRGGGVRTIFTADGKNKIESLEEFEKAQSTGFVACGTESYKEVKGGYESIGKNKKDQQKPDTNKKQETGKKEKDDLSASKPEREESFLEKNKRKYGDQPRSDDQRLENRVDVGVIKRINVYRNGDQHYKPKTYIYKSKTMRNWEKFLEEMSKMAPPMKGGSVRHVYQMNGEIEIVNFDELEEGEGYVVAGIEGYATLKNGYENVGKPEGSPKNIFKNGNGLEAKRFIFTPKQIDKGMPWLLEQIGKKFNIYAKKIVTMDNRDVHTVNDLETKGAYVVIPLGETFRDTWYYLPALAKDTSADAQENGRGQQGDEDYDEENPGGRNRGRSRRYSDDNYDEEYDSRTESGQEYYSDEERSSRRRDQGKHNHRPGSAASYCSYCDMLERHRQKHHYYSDDEEAPTKSRRGSYRPYSAEPRNNSSPPAERRRPPATSDRRRQSPTSGRNTRTTSRRPSKVYEDEPYEDEYEEDDYRESPPPQQRRSSNQKANPSLRRAKSEASMVSNKTQSRQPNNSHKNNVTNKKSNSAGQPQKQKAKPINQTQINNKSPKKTPVVPARSKSQSNLNKANSNTRNAKNQPPGNSKAWK